MQSKYDHYEYIACYVNDLAITSRELKHLLKSLRIITNWPIFYHLGANFWTRSRWCSNYDSNQVHRLDDGFLSASLWHRTQKMYNSPFEKCDHRVLNTSPEFDIEGIKIYSMWL